MGRYLLLLIGITLFISCNNKSQEIMSKEKKPNALINESSPYLLQHAYNPVDWKPWGDEVLEEAESENKPLIISIGYSSCHWCHVMEEESFEDDSIAKLMNENFISIKVDREERPDVDQVYMDAVQLMTGKGGWPLNVIALPDGRPIYGGTYHTKTQWKQVLDRISEIYRENPEQLVTYAEKLANGIETYNLVEPNPENPDFTAAILEDAVDAQINNLDFKRGGSSQAPKFPLPNNIEFLMRYGFQSGHKQISYYVETTLQYMALGGIYDQVGGGFSRYSTDEKWHIPHFEKMLYDNAQLVSLYSKAYSLSKQELYKETVYGTLAFVEKELIAENGAFYSSWDADSKNDEDDLVEGAFYVWSEAELQQFITDDFNLFKEYYNVNSYGKWENEQYVLIRKSLDEDFAQDHNLSIAELRAKVDNWKKILALQRDKRSKPRLDNKCLTSWNGLMLKGFIDAYAVFGEPKFLRIAERNAQFIYKNMLKPDGGLYHTYKDGNATINGYLEDYATVISAFIELYSVTANDEYLLTAKGLCDYAIDHFYDSKSGLFFFTSDEDSRLITRKIEIYDNVIASSNSIMAKNLFKLSHLFNESGYKSKAETMLNTILPQYEEAPGSFNNWLDLLANYVGPYYEVAISGKASDQLVTNFTSQYFPNILLATSEKESEIPLMENRFNDTETYIYVCVDGSCRLPVKTAEEAFKLIQKKF